MAVQVIHTGSEAYENVNFGTNLGAILDDVFTFKTKLDEKYYEIKQAEEMWAIGMMDVDAAGLTLSKFQEAAKKGIDEYVSFASDMYKSKEVLRGDEKMQIANRRTQLKTQIEEFKAKNIQFNNMLKQVEMHPQYYDQEETQAAFAKFIEDPINNPVPMPVPAYVDIAYTIVAQLNKGNPLRMRQEGQKQTLLRVGCETEEQQYGVVGSIISGDSELQRSIMHEMKKKGLVKGGAAPTLDEMTEYVMSEHQVALFPNMEGYKTSGIGGSRGKQPTRLISTDKAFREGVDLKTALDVGISKGSKLYNELNVDDISPSMPKLRLVSVHEDRVELTFEAYAEVGKVAVATSMATPNVSGQKETPTGDGNVRLSTKNDKKVTIYLDDEQGMNEVMMLMKTMKESYGNYEAITKTYNAFMDLYNSKWGGEIDYNKYKKRKQ